jgi:hypothetical protein
MVRAKVIPPQPGTTERKLVELLGALDFDQLQFAVRIKTKAGFVFAGATGETRRLEEAKLHPTLTTAIRAGAGWGAFDVVGVKIITRPKTPELIVLEMDLRHARAVQDALADATLDAIDPGDHANAAYEELTRALQRPVELDRTVDTW